MQLKRIAGLLAALVFAFAVVACDGDEAVTEAPDESPAAATEVPAE